MFTIASHCQIMVQLDSKKFVSQFTCKLCNWFYFLFPFNAPCICVQIFDVIFFAKKFWDLNKAFVYVIFTHKTSPERDLYMIYRLAVQQSHFLLEDA